MKYKVSNEKVMIDTNVSKRMKGNKSRDTKPELILRRLLREKKIKGYRLCYTGIDGKPDVVFTRWKLAVFLHGCFWHVCQDCKLKTPVKNNDFWTAKLKKNQDRDNEVLSLLKSKGWNVITIWECKLKKDPALEVSKIEQFLQKAKMIG